MTPSQRNGLDLLAVTAAAIATIMIVVYLGLMNQQDDDAAAWFVSGLVVAALLSIFGAVRAAPGRRWALAVAGVTMMILGLLGILSIGFPILVAGVLALVAASRTASGHPTPVP